MSSAACAASSTAAPDAPPKSLPGSSEYNMTTTPTPKTPRSQANCWDDDDADVDRPFDRRVSIVGSSTDGSVRPLSSGAPPPSSGSPRGGSSRGITSAPQRSSSVAVPPAPPPLSGLASNHSLLDSDGGGGGGRWRGDERSNGSATRHNSDSGLSSVEIVAPSKSGPGNSFLRHFSRESSLGSVHSNGRQSARSRRHSIGKGKSKSKGKSKGKSKSKMKRRRSASLISVGSASSMNRDKDKSVIYKQRPPTASPTPAPPVHAPGDTTTPGEGPTVGPKLDDVVALESLACPSQTDGANNHSDLADLSAQPTNHRVHGGGGESPSVAGSVQTGITFHALDTLVNGGGQHSRSRSHQQQSSVARTAVDTREVQRMESEALSGKGRMVVVDEEPKEAKRRLKRTRRRRRHRRASPGAAAAADKAGAEGEERAEGRRRHGRHHHSRRDKHAKSGGGGGGEGVSKHNSPRTPTLPASRPSSRPQMAAAAEAAQAPPSLPSDQAKVDATGDSDLILRPQPPMKPRTNSMQDGRPIEGVIDNRRCCTANPTERLASQRLGGGGDPLASTGSPRLTASSPPPSPTPRALAAIGPSSPPADASVAAAGSPNASAPLPLPQGSAAAAVATLRQQQQQQQLDKGSKSGSPAGADRSVSSYSYSSVGSLHQDRRHRHDGRPPPRGGRANHSSSPSSPRGGAPCADAKDRKRPPSPPRSCSSFSDDGGSSLGSGSYYSYSYSDTDSVSSEEKLARARLPLREGCTSLPPAAAFSDMAYRMANVATLQTFAEPAVIHEWDLAGGFWGTVKTQVVINAEPFSKGNMRASYHLIDMGRLDCRLVAKRYLKPSVKDDQYYDDVSMHSISGHWARMYNAMKPPKKVKFVPAAVLELTSRSPPMILALEPQLDGIFQKYNNNAGYVPRDARWTPQAFSHFTYEASGYELMIVDIQGVDDIYTDPQILSPDGEGYGRGNLGRKGIQRFISSHRCNNVCRALGLTPLRGGGGTGGEDGSSKTPSRITYDAIDPSIKGELLPPKHGGSRQGSLGKGATATGSGGGTALTHVPSNGALKTGAAAGPSSGAASPRGNGVYAMASASPYRTPGRNARAAASRHQSGYFMGTPAAAGGMMAVAPPARPTPTGSTHAGPYIRPPTGAPGSQNPSLRRGGDVIFPRGNSAAPPPPLSSTETREPYVPHKPLGTPAVSPAGARPYRR